MTTVHHVDSPATFNRLTREAGLAVVDFSATWCGPCQRIKPEVARLAAAYPKVTFVEVDEAKNRALVQQFGVTAYPTFLFLSMGSEKERFSGADPQQLESVVRKYKSLWEGFAAKGGGKTLGGGSSAGVSRLLGGAPSTSPANAAAAAAPAAAEANATAAAAAGDPRANDKEEAGAAVELVTPEVDQSLLGMLKDMGFGEHRGVRALHFSGNRNMEAAIAWLEAHENDADIDSPLLLAPGAASGGGQKLGAAASPAKAKSWRCVETGKLFRSMRDVNIYAEKTGRTNFEESDQGVAPLTAEEKEEKKRALQARIKAAQAARKQKEKAEKLAREKSRRESGKYDGSMREEGLRLKRMRDAKAKMKEKERVKRERERLRAELAKDKAERAAAKALREGKKVDTSLAARAIEKKEAWRSKELGHEPAKRKTTKTPVEQAQVAIKMLRMQKVGTGGIAALKIVRVFLRNVQTKPQDEDKWRTINLGNAKVKAKVMEYKGSLSLLLAVGFEKRPPTEDLPAGSMFLAKPYDAERVKAIAELVQKGITDGPL